MRKNILLIALSLIITTGLIGCKKDKFDYTFEGKWELGYINYMDRDVVLHGIHKPRINFIENINIIYDFQKNNKLVITTTFASGELKQSEHIYTYIQEGYHPWSSPPQEYQGSYTLQIDTNKFHCVVNPGGGKIMYLIGFCASNGVIIDEIDLEILKYDKIYSWQKTFYELK